MMPPITTLQGVMSPVLQMGKLRWGSHTSVRTGTAAGRDHSQGLWKGQGQGRRAPAEGLLWDKA